MKVAPLTASIFALCLVRADWRSFGRAGLLIESVWASPPLLLTAVTSVIFPLVMVTRTCVVPYWVVDAAPVT